jgi:hypothetical protein
MTNLGMHFIFGFTTGVFAEYGMWIFLSVGAIMLFGIFIPTVHWIDSRRKEREAFYKAETFRRVAESSGEGAKAAVEMLREEELIKQVKVREGLKMAGLINVATGLALTIFLHGLLRGSGSVYLCGLIPGFIGLAMLAYVYLLAEPLR